MAWFGRKIQPAPAPKRLLWSEELWREATTCFAGDTRFHALIMVRRAQTKVAWEYGSRTPNVSMQYFGRLGFEAGSLVEHIRADVVFDVDSHAPNDRHAWPESLGLAFTNQYDDGGGAFPMFVLKIWSNEAGAQLFERVFDRALAAGHDHLPVWISAGRRADRVEESERFGVIQPVTSIRFEQGVSLGGRRQGRLGSAVSPTL